MVHFIMTILKSNEREDFNNVNEKKSQPYPYRDEGGSDQILRTVCVLQLFDQRAL